MEEECEMARTSGIVATQASLKSQPGRYGSVENYKYFFLIKSYL